MSEHTLLLTLMALALILLFGRGTAELSARFGQPEVIGELLGGLLLGPSVLGAVFPALHRYLFGDPQVQTALETMSWVGALLLLLIAGMEADIKILRPHWKPGTLAALFVIAASLAAGTIFSASLLKAATASAVYLGVVLSVTAVSVAAKILVESESVRRNYAQVILSAGIVSEVVVWLVVSTVASWSLGRSWLAATTTALWAAVFFCLMLTVGRRAIFWSMRRMSDFSYIAGGKFTLVLLLCFLSAAATQAMGLHALLGAFVAGALLSQSPRVSYAFKEQVQSMTVSLFAPIFFVLAGMQVNLLQLRSTSALAAVLALFLLSAVVKCGMGALGARLGGLPGREAVLVGVGLNLKGGTDLVVAIIGTKLGLFSIYGYTIYAVVALATVLLSPPVMTYLQARVPISKGELERLNKEEAKKRAYLADTQRILAPMLPELLPSNPACILNAIAESKRAEQEVFDITAVEYHPERASLHNRFGDVLQAEAQLKQAGDEETVEVVRKRLESQGDVKQEVLDQARDFKLLAIGAEHPRLAPVLSFGKPQDAVIREAPCDVLVVVQEKGQLERAIKRILVPINGMEYSAAAADIAAYIAKAYQAEVVLFHMMPWEVDSLFWREATHPELLDAGYRILHEVKFRTERLDVKTIERVRVGEDPAQAILRELRRVPYQLLVLGALERRAKSGVHLGKHTQSVVTQAAVPIVLLITHSLPGTVAAAA